MIAFGIWWGMLASLGVCAGVAHARAQIPDPSRPAPPPFKPSAAGLRWEKFAKEMIEARKIDPEAERLMHELRQDPRGYRLEPGQDPEQVANKLRKIQAWARFTHVRPAYIPRGTFKCSTREPY